MYRVFYRFSKMWISALGILGLCAVLRASEVVDLSNQGLTREEFFVKIQRTIDLHNVTDLILRHNEFDSFLDCSTKLDNLKKLDLSENHLQRFFFLCKEEYNLEVLNVSHNDLLYIDDYALNDRIPKLKVLDLSWNKLTVFNETMVEQLKVLEFLSVANNPITEIHDKSLETLKALLHLDLSNLSVSSFSSALFKPLISLTFLNISGNSIKTIPILPASLQELDISRTNIFRPDNLVLPKLVALHMNYMPEFRELVLNDLENLTMLETLSVEGCRRLNRLVIWDGNQLLPRLQRFSVRGCALESLNGDLMPIMRRTPAVDLRDNPWHCDCRMTWVKTLNSTSDMSDGIRCRIPPEHEGKLLAQIQGIDLVCEEESYVIYHLIRAMVSILTLSLIAIAIFFITKKAPISQWKLPKLGGNTVSYKNVVESNNDLIRILPPGEASDRAEE